jgi:Asp-tRNA(Asn)/Glu-tRNA(Gln) amidotransferase A subunit family amidase
MIQEYTVSAKFIFMTASELRRLVAAREIFPVELTERAEATQDRLNAFFMLMPEEARAAGTNEIEAEARVGLENEGWA